MAYVCVFALLLVSLAPLSTCADGVAADVLWPRPQEIACQAASSPLPVSSAFTVKTHSKDATVLQLAAQYQSIIRAEVAHPISSATTATTTTRDVTAKPTLAGLQLTVKTNATKPLDSYVVSFAGASKSEAVAELTLTATTVRAAGYALETAAQLLEGGVLNCSTLTLTDFPTLAVRELRVDAASRYIPLDALDSIVRGMQAAKLNVLTLHLADYAGVRAESSAYHALTDDMNGYYRHYEIDDFVKYAAEHGIDVVPEYDLPARAGAFNEIDDVSFCDKARFVLANNNKTIEAASKWLSDTLSFYPAARVNLGGSNMTFPAPKTNASCTTADSINVLSSLVAVATKAKVSVGVWQEATDAAAGTLGDVTTYVTDAVAALPKYLANAAAILAGGHANNDGQLVLPGTTATRKTVAADGYINFTKGLEPGQLKNFLGVSASFFAYEYCSTPLCGGDSGNASAPLASWMQKRFQDKPFVESMLHLIFPSVASTAGAAWNYANMTADALEASLRRFAIRADKRGVHACQGDCVCTVLKSCAGKYSKESKVGEVVGVGFIFGVTLASIVSASVLIVQIRYIKSKRSASYELLN